VLERTFDAGTLAELRQDVLAYSLGAGASQSRASDLVVAVHELAANAVRHGAGRGRVRLQDGNGRLYCQVDDDGAAATGGYIDAAYPDEDGQAHLGPWPARPGHGLWVVHALADQLTVRSGPEGSQVVAIFSLPEARQASPAG